MYPRFAFLLGLCLCPGVWTPFLGASVVVNEIHPSPDIKQERVEFIELFNAGPDAVDLTGWRLEDAVGFVFPEGSRIGSGQFLVVAGDPQAVERKFPVTGVVGPWTGRLSGNGEQVRLRDAAGVVVDEVDYQVGFPWPTVGDSPGFSMELVHPDLDNSLGGNWRASVVGDITPATMPLVNSGATWRFRKGTAAPSDPPSRWHEADFDDAAWSEGRAPVGYDPDVAIATPLSDMRGGYSQFFLRREMDVVDADTISALRLEALFDDGFKFWINGRLLFSESMGAGEVPFDALASGSARENNGYQRFESPVPPGVLREGRNEIAVQVANINLGNSSDALFDARLIAIVGPTGRGPTPGGTNVVFATNAPPAVRQVSHVPEQPRTGERVRISARVTDPDGVDSVTLEYQVLTPGNYIEQTDPAYRTQWTPLAMSSLPADAAQYSVELPTGIVRHRNLIRYRIVARDRLGFQGRSPQFDDPQPNFALFCHDGVPEWNGAVRPGATGEAGTPFTVGRDEMNRLPVYHLIAKKESVEASTWYDRSHGDEYFWTGTLVYDGEVYDHIRFRPRGGVWRYAMGKNMWKFDFNRGHDFKARDNWGRRYRTSWTKLNLGASIQQGDYNHRGEQGLFESVGFRLFQLVGLPASQTTFVQFRIVDEADETKGDDQFNGDFWGVYLAVEQLDGRFLDEHGLPDGNLFKMENGFGEQNNLGPDGPVDASDLRAFLDVAYPEGNADLPDSWWRTNLNLEAYFSYQTIVQGIHHYDIADGKNYFYYHNPVDRRWMVVPWDLDLTWADSMYRGGQTGGDEPFKSRVLSNFRATPARPELVREFRNRVREVRDLLWNGDEAYRLIDEYAARLRGPGGSSLLDADRAQWDYNPLMTNSAVVIPSKAGQGRFYRFPGAPGVVRRFEGAVQLMKNYVGYRGTNATFSLDTMAEEPGLPETPTITYAGPSGFPVNRLAFRSEAYSGTTAFRSVRWRVGEISRVGHPAHDPAVPMRYEIESVWDSGELTSAGAEPQIPAGVLKVGRLYRVRARFMDAEGRASHWSAPVEFTVGEPVGSGDLARDLEWTELMYNPPADGFEFLELHNRHATDPLVLDGAVFSEGISYVFPPGSRLNAGEYALVVRTADVAAFRRWNGLSEDVRVFGPYGGSLDNGGEPVVLRTAPGGAVILGATYDDVAPWPESADGGGFSLVPRAGGSPDLNDAGHWRASTEPKGSPGRADPEPGPRVDSYAWTPAGLEVRFAAGSSVAWRAEVGDVLGAWAPMSTNVGPAVITLPANAASPLRFLRGVPWSP